MKADSDDTWIESSRILPERVVKVKISEFQVASMLHVSRSCCCGTCRSTAVRSAASGVQASIDELSIVIALPGNSIVGSST